jgi:hypothetical protein
MARKVAVEVPYMKKVLGGTFGYMSEKPAHQIEVADIPEKSRSEIVQALRQKGRPTTDEEVRRIYLRHMIKKSEAQ